jgi:hypothetical protein
MWNFAGDTGSCKPPRFQVITGILLRSGLTAWLRTPQGLSQMHAVAVPKAFDVPGPLFYAVPTRGPDNHPAARRRQQDRVHHASTAWARSDQRFAAGSDRAEKGKGRCHPAS